MDDAAPRGARDGSGADLRREPEDGTVGASGSRHVGRAGGSASDRHAPAPGLTPSPRASAAARWQARARHLRRLARLGRKLPAFLAHPTSTGDAREWVRVGLADRERRFLDLVQHAVFGNPSSPYLPLLRLAGCEPGDLTGLLAREGLEGSLVKLRDAGFYLTFDEFKGRRDVERGSQRLRFRERDFDMPGEAPALTAASGGTRGPATRVRTSLPHLTDLARATALALDAHDIGHAEHAVWLVSGLTAVLLTAKLGRPPVTWFHPLPLSRGTRFSALYVTTLSRITRCPLPRPRRLPLEQPEAMAHWLAARARAGPPVCVTTYASSAVRVARSAREAGLDLAGVTFITLGEPFTAAKRAAVEAAGARALVRYAFTEAGIIGFACATPRASDDLHFFDNAHAMIPRTRRVGAEGPTVEALLFTSLLPSAPKVLINVESGDSASVARRACGCRLGAAGLTTHLESIRSFEKLSGEGMTFIQLDLLEVLEGALPARFGGVGADYQVVEEEDGEGILHLTLSVSPRVGPVDLEEVRGVFLDALARQPTASRAGVQVWRAAETVRVARRVPVATAAGKILPFHVAPR